jgi:hypothetical protein
MTDHTVGAVSFFGRRVPASFEVRLIALAPGCRRPYDEAEWRGALVVIEAGEVALECLGGACRSFERGAVLWLAGLPLCAIHNRGLEPALVSAVTRRGRSAEAPATVVVKS